MMPNQSPVPWASLDRTETASRLGVIPTTFMPHNLATMATLPRATKTLPAARSGRRRRKRRSMASTTRSLAPTAIVPTSTRMVLLTSGSIPLLNSIGSSYRLRVLAQLMVSTATQSSQTLHSNTSVFLSTRSFPPGCGRGLQKRWQTYMV